MTTISKKAKKKVTSPKVRTIEPNEISKALGAEPMDDNDPTVKRLKRLFPHKHEQSDLRGWSDIILPDKKNKK